MAQPGTQTRTRGVGVLAGEQPRHHHPLQRLEGLGVAEEAGDPDQQVAEQQADLVAVLLQPRGVVVEWQSMLSTCMRRCTRRKKVLSL